MPVSQSFRQFAIEMLRRFAPAVTDRSMFGGVGIYSHGQMFALLAEDQLYLKADGDSREKFLAEGLEPFRPFGEDGVVIQYYDVPLEWLEHGDQLESWVALALASAAAKRAKDNKKKQPSERSTLKKQTKNAAAKIAPRSAARVSKSSPSDAVDTAEHDAGGPDFSRGENRLLPAIAQDHATGEVLMMAWMNEESFAETMATGRAVYYSRSRGKLWRKGEESGHMQTVHGVYVDCDADTILLKVSQVGAACHEGFRSCFFRQVSPLGLTVVADRLVEPASVYKNPKSHAKSAVVKSPKKASAKSAKKGTKKSK